MEKLTASTLFKIILYTQHDKEHVISVRLDINTNLALNKRKDFLFLFGRVEGIDNLKGILLQNNFQTWRIFISLTAPTMIKYPVSKQYQTFAFNEVTSQISFFLV